MVIFGEIGLSGEVRAVTQPTLRMKEAQKFFEGDTPKFWLNPTIKR